jgi:hypothetical protein
MWGVPTSLKGFFPGDDAQDPDIYVLVGNAVGPLTGGAATDLLWQNQGSTGPITPTNYVAKITALTIASGASSGQEITIYALNTVAATSALTPVGRFTLPGQQAGGSIQFNADTMRLLAPPNCKFQAAAAISADIVALARYVKGAGQ